MLMGLALLTTIPDGTMILYDGTTVPSGWQVVATFDGRFPRACTPAGSAGGSEKHTHDWIYGSTGYPTSSVTRYGMSGGSGATWDHYHDIWSSTTLDTVDSASHIPPFRKFLVLRKVGEGYGLPAGAILFFEDDGFSSSWQVIMRDSFPRATSDPTQVGQTGGSNGHYHTAHGWTSVNYQAQSGSPGSQPAAAEQHRHHWTGWTLEDTTKPPYIYWYIARLSVDTEDIPLGAIAMFDAEPTGSPSIGTWTIPVTLQNAGGDDCGRIPRGASGSSQLGATGGSTYHSHPMASLTLEASDSASPGLCYSSGECSDYYYSKSYAPVGHNHYVNPSDYYTSSAIGILPPYRCVLFRRKVNSVGVGVGGSGGGSGAVKAGATLLVFGEPGTRVIIYDPTGRALIQRTLRAEREEVSLRGLGRGVYIVVVGRLVVRVLAVE